jgi:hypothetical protein
MKSNGMVEEYLAAMTFHIFRYYRAFRWRTIGGLTFFRMRYPQMGHFISGVTANCSAVTLVPQLMHSYWMPPDSESSPVFFSVLMLLVTFSSTAT